MEEFLLERLSLSKDRIEEIVNDREFPGFSDEDQKYMMHQAKWLLQTIHVYERAVKKEFQPDALTERTVEELLRENKEWYQELLDYEESYCNPTVSCKIFGLEKGQLLSFLASELRSTLIYAFEEKIHAFLIRLELFLEIYGAYRNAYEELHQEPDVNEVREIIYWFVSDYMETEVLQKINGLVNPNDNFFANIVLHADLTKPQYLFSYGEYITEDEVRLARFMAALPEEKIELMASTYTEGYRMGFVSTGKDLSLKKTVNVRYVAGFERMVRKVMEQFEKMGLKTTIYRAPVSVLNGRSAYKAGFYGHIANKQYEYDHKDDLALVFDKKLSNRMLEETKVAYEELKDWASGYAGPSLIEVFGETPFEPTAKKENLRYNEEQQKLRLEYANANAQLMNEYIKGDETSFTIIAFPVPQIGEQFEEIFEEIIRVNTLPYKQYEEIQAKIIDALNECISVEVKGMNGNRTDLHINLHPVQDQSKEVIFENCVADVNIPVGEVFTSPVLKGTEGLLHVSEVFLKELKYEDLSVWFSDGMISGYDCGNFKEPKDNQNYIKENVLFHHDSIPLGEFAIGTNTYAYMLGRKYKIQDKFPILIAEKTGPHFAVGDTCYSHAEDVKVYNPDGREIVARDNEVSIKRKTEPDKAYFNCHTDITIPYDELGQLYGIRADQSKVMIIENGRFVLPGTETLNIPLEKE